MALEPGRWGVTVPLAAVGVWAALAQASEAAMPGGNVENLSATGILAIVILALWLEAVRWRRRHAMISTEVERARHLLEQEVARRQLSERRLMRQTGNLGQRVREINCLYALSKVFTRRDLSWEEVCQQTMELLPRHFHDRERVFVRLACNGIVFRTRLFRDDCMRVSREVVVEGQVIGLVEFFYLSSKDLDYRMLFLGRERNLLDELCERLINFFERRLAEERALAAQDEAERANLAKSQFFAAASHDLRQPLQAMHLFHQILVQRLTDPRDRSVADLLGDALGQTDDLLQPLLEIAKLDAGTVEPEVVSFQLGDLLNRVAADRMAEASGKGLCVKVMPTTAKVRSDPILLGRIVDNLITNAVRHTPDGRIVIGSRRRGGKVAIEVWDTGPGIGADHLPAVFQEFYQVGNAERDRRRGLGLGLAIAERTARLLGHHIGVRSVPDKGSVFFIELPPARGEVSAGPLAPGDVRTASRRVA